MQPPHALQQGVFLPLLPGQVGLSRLAAGEIRIHADQVAFEAWHGLDTAQIQIKLY